MNDTAAPRRAFRGTAVLSAAAAMLASLLTASPASADSNAFLDSTGEADCCATPETDIARYSVSLDAMTLVSRVQLVSWSQAALDGAHVITRLEVTGDDVADYRLIRAPGTGVTRLEDERTGAPLACEVATEFSEEGRTFSMSLAASCVGSPEAVRVDHVIATSDEVFDAAPDVAPFSSRTTSGPQSGPDLAITGVYRFWSPVFDNAHFFTTDPVEAANLAFDRNWEFEGEAFAAYAAADGSCPGATTVYRFHSPRFETHFFTASPAEAHVIRTTDRNWNFEGVAYCAVSAQEPGTTALFRFWSPVFRKHHFTADPAEAHQLRTSDPNWSFEGTAYHVNS